MAAYDRRQEYALVPFQPVQSDLAYCQRRSQPTAHRVRRQDATALCQRQRRIVPPRSVARPDLTARAEQRARLAIELQCVRCAHARFRYPKAIPVRRPAPYQARSSSSRAIACLAVQYHAKIRRSPLPPWQVVGGQAQSQAHPAACNRAPVPSGFDCVRRRANCDRRDGEHRKSATRGALEYWSGRNRSGGRGLRVQ